MLANARISNKVPSQSSVSTPQFQQRQFVTDHKPPSSASQGQDINDEGKTNYQRFDFSKIPLFPDSAPVDTPIQAQFQNRMAMRLPVIPWRLSFGSQPNREGKPLPRTLRKKMENSFGEDFSNVRIHQSTEASSLKASAFTQGRDIHFASGEYNPTSTEGQKLIGHELTHVIQQRSGIVRLPSRSGLPINESPTLEKEADRIGIRAAQGMYNAPFMSQPTGNNQQAGRSSVVQLNSEDEDEDSWDLDDDVRDASLSDSSPEPDDSIDDDFQEPTDAEMAEEGRPDAQFEMGGGSKSYRSGMRFYANQQHDTRRELMARQGLRPASPGHEVKGRRVHHFLPQTGGSDIPLDAEHREMRESKNPKDWEQPPIDHDVDFLALDNAMNEDPPGSPAHTEALKEFVYNYQPNLNIISKDTHKKKPTERRTTLSKKLKKRARDVIEQAKPDFYKHKFAQKRRDTFRKRLQANTAVEDAKKLGLYGRRRDDEDDDQGGGIGVMRVGRPKRRFNAY